MDAKLMLFAPYLQTGTALEALKNLRCPPLAGQSMQDGHFHSLLSKGFLYPQETPSCFHICFLSALQI